MSDIAKLAGVARPTVSFVLSGQWRARRISPSLAARVEKIAAECNYRPNRLVHALRTGKTNVVALILPVMTGEYFPRIADGIEDEAKRHGYHLLISRVRRGLEEEVSEIEVLLERRVDGLILVPRYGEANRENYRRLIKEGIPMVFVDSYFPDVPCPAVVGDHETGLYAATEHLIGLGHRRIGYVGDGLPEQTYLTDRLTGYRKAMSKHGLAVPDAYVVKAKTIAPDGALDLLRLRERPTAVVCVTDYEALGVIRAARTLGLRVPEDVAVIGFGDSLADVDEFRTPISSVRLDPEEMGRLAMRRFLCEVKQVSGRHEVIRVPAGLVARASSAGARDVGPEQGEAV